MKYILRNESIAVFKHIRQTTNTRDSSFDAGFQGIWDTYLNGLKKLILEYSTADEVELHELNDIEHIKRKLINYKPLILDSYSTLGGVKLGVSRVFGKYGKKLLYIGGRPGYMPVREQLRYIKKYQGTISFSLVEDDIYSGGTIQKLIDLCYKESIWIKEVIVGIQVAEKPKVTIPVRAVYKYKPNEVCDVCDPRDFTFGLYEAGLVLKTQSHHRVPYVLPFVDVHKRASITLGKEADFSRSIINYNKALFCKINVLVGRNIKISDFEPSFASYMTHYFAIGDVAILDLLDLTLTKI